MSNPKNTMVSGPLVSNISKKKLIETLDEVDNEYEKLLKMVLDYQYDTDAEWRDQIQINQTYLSPQFSDQTIENLGVKIRNWQWYDSMTVIVFVDIAVGNFSSYFDQIIKEQDFQPITGIQFIAKPIPSPSPGFKHIDVSIDFQDLYNPKTKNEFYQSYNYATLLLSWIRAYTVYIGYFTPI